MRKNLKKLIKYFKDFFLRIFFFKKTFFINKPHPFFFFFRKKTKQYYSRNRNITTNKTKKHLMEQTLFRLTIE